MSVKIRTKNRRLYLDVYHNGIRKWEALKISLTEDKDTNREILKTAEICRAKRELQILTYNWGMSDPVGGNISLLSYMTKIMENAQKELYKKNIYCALVHLKAYSDGGKIQLKQITPLWVRRYYEYLEKERGLKPKTAKNYEGTVRAAIRKAVNENLIPADPTIGIKTAKVNEPYRIHLNIGEIQKLADTVSKHKYGELIKRAFLFACNTGLRISDLISLKWENICYEPLQIIKRQFKTDVNVIIPLNKNAWRIINDGRIHNHSEPVFDGLHKYYHYQFVKWICKEAGIVKKVGWHTARRTFAVLSLESGADIYTVSKLLGHTDIKTTQVYAKATDKMKREAVNALPELRVK